MKRLLSALLVVINVFLLVSCSSSSGPKLDVEDQLGKMKTADNIYYSENKDYESAINWLKYEVEEAGFKGTLIVATDDEILFASGARALDIDGNEVTPYTTYEIGSCSKAFVAVCIMKLIEDGKLKMTDTLGDLFPDYSSYPNYEDVSKITISDLLHMRSGLIDYIDRPDLFLGEERVYELLGSDPVKYTWAEAYRIMEPVITDELFMELVFTNDLDFEPDSQYSYCNSNYHLLALLIEKISGRSYAEYVNEIVFEPCKMTYTSAVSSGDVTAAFEYEAEYDYLKDPKFLKGAGDIHTNAVDMIKFDRALFGGYLLNEDSMELMLTFIDDYGCGWTKIHGNTGHTGALPRFLTSNCVIEKDGKKIYVLSFTTLHENKRDMLVENLNRIIRD
ncbi:MAG: serine hydrolase [Clostridiales bacterium]|nr:serine hydrolase [Clostridiales bacterium]